MPESMTAQQMPSQRRSNSSVAASALIVLRERHSAGRAGRLRLIAHSSGRPGGGTRGTSPSASAARSTSTSYGQARGRLVLGLVVVGVRGLPRDPADEPDEPDQRARQLARGGRPAALLAHRLLQAGDDLGAARLEDRGHRLGVARPQVLLPPVRQRQDAAQHLLERQPDGDVRAVVGQLDRLRSRRASGRPRARPWRARRSSSRRRARAAGRARRCGSRPYCSQTSGMTGESCVKRLSCSVPKIHGPRFLNSSFTASSTHGGPAGVKRVTDATCVRRTCAQRGAIAGARRRSAGPRAGASRSSRPARSGRARRARSAGCPGGRR